MRDLWSDPEENRRFFRQMGVPDDRIIPVKADATALPFPEEFFDAVISTDSYNYFGRDPAFLDSKLLPFVKKGGYLYIAIPGMKRDCHDNLPPELLLSWTPEQLDYLHDVIVVTRSKHHINERIESLEREGLFPLPEKAYTKRYLMFSRLVKSSVGRNILLLTLPLASWKKIR